MRRARRKVMRFRHCTYALTLSVLLALFAVPEAYAHANHDGVAGARVPGNALAPVTAKYAASKPDVDSAIPCCCRVGCSGGLAMGVSFTFLMPIRKTASRLLH